jgi:hypothetical protein
MASHRGRDPSRKANPATPRGPRGKSLPARLAGALNEPIYATINGRRRKITK